MVIGSLNNLDALCAWLIEQERDILVLGSGGKTNSTSKTPFAQAVIADKCLESGRFFADEDSTVAAKFISLVAGQHVCLPQGILSPSHELRKLNLNDDVKYCLTPNNCTAIPILKNGLGSIEP